MRLFLVAHAATPWTVVRRFQGHTDIPLSETGRRQAHILQKHLARERFQAIMASDLQRAVETAEILASPHAMAVRTDPRLRELYFGAWEGLTYEEIQQRDAAALADWQKDPLGMSPPQGERLTDLADRLRFFLLELQQVPEASTILLVAHRGSLRVLICLLLGKPVAEQRDIHLEVASLSEVTVAAGQAMLVRLNETLGEA
jgi:alpha-ribazole phosphatase